MNELQWYPGGLAEWNAWCTTDGAFAEATFTIEKTHLGFRLSARSASTYDELFALHLMHQQYRFEDAQRLAELLRGEAAAVQGEATVDVAIAQARLDASSRRQRCGFVHAFPSRPTEATPCACGRVTFGWASAHQQAS